MFCWTVHLNGQRRSGGQAVAVEHKVYYFEGVCDDNTTPIGVSVFNTITLRWRKLPGTGKERPLQGCTAVLIEYIIYIWGGYPYCNVLYAFDVDTHRWFKPKVSGTVPERRNHSACVLGKVMFIHGGCDLQHYGSTNDICKLDTTTMVWSLIDTRGTPPPVSIFHSATIIRTKMFVFGGKEDCGEYWDYGEYGVYNNFIRVFDTETNCWLNTPSAHLLPERRYNQSAFSYNGELYMYGTVNHPSTQYLNDLWNFNPETFSWKRVEPKGEGPAPTYRMCCCMVGDRVILSGGFYRPDDLIILDLSPSLKTLCKLAVIQYSLEQSELPHNIRWELAAMTTKSNRE